MAGNDSTSSREAASNEFNCAMEAIGQGDRSRAVRHYQTAMDLLPEESANDRAFKTFVAYQYGVCLARMHGLESASPLSDLLSHLNESDPDDRGLLVRVHRRLATLCNDDRDFYAAAKHAKWVLKDGPADEMSQAAMRPALNNAREHGVWD